MSQLLAAIPHVDKQQAEQEQTGQEIDPRRPLEIRARRSITIDVALANAKTHTGAFEGSIRFLVRRRISLTTVLVVIIRSIGGNMPKPTLVGGFTGLTNGLDGLTCSWQRSLCIEGYRFAFVRRRIGQLSGRLAVKGFGTVAPILHKRGWIFHVDIGRKGTPALVNEKDSISNFGEERVRRDGYGSAIGALGLVG